MIDEALRNHKNMHMKLGEWLIKNGHLTERQIIDAVSQQLHLSVYSPDRYAQNPDLAQLLPKDIASKKKIVPLESSRNVLELAVLDPMDVQTLDLVTRLTGMDVEPVICAEKDFQPLFERIYGGILQAEEMPHAESTLSSDFENIDIDASVCKGQDDSSYSDSYLISLAEDAPIVRLANSILVHAMVKGASDIHISQDKAAVRVRIRVDGKLLDILAPPKRVFLPLISRLKLLAGIDIAVTRVPQDGRFTFRVGDREVNVRASTLPTVFGEKIVLRLFNQVGSGLPLGELGMHPPELAKIERAAAKPYGMLLATGPTGSGKTTLLHALLARINRPDINIITLEDPVEYMVSGITQVQLNRKAGMTFASGLRSILRQDPDVIMVGEIRDAETATIAIEAALTGHLVLSTLHANNSVGTVTRLVEMGVEPFLITSTLHVVVAQRLLRRVCQGCKASYVAGEDVRQLLGGPPGPLTLWRGQGCKACSGTGYKGRIGIYEALDMTDPIKDLIIRHASATQIKHAALESGNLRTLQADAAQKVLDGITTVEEFISVNHTM
jgi:type IV pilus assembly protein PilB